MWSKLLLRRFRQPGKNPLLPVLQGIAAFRLTLSRMPPRHSQTRRDTNFAIPGYSLSAMIPRRTVKIKFFLSVVIPVVKAAFVPFSAIGGNPASAGVARLCGVSPHPIPDTTTALPNVAPYQLSHTRLFTFLPLYHGGGENQRFFCLWSFMWSKPLLCRFQQPGEIPQTQASQGFAAFRLTLSRIPPRRSQSRRATNCATPGY